jgi:hypothetical protein
LSPYTFYTAKTGYSPLDILIDASGEHTKRNNKNK